MNAPVIPLTEYADRRKKVLSAIGKSVAIVFAGESHGEDFEVDAQFVYLTGIDDEPGAMLVLDGAAPLASRKAMLFLRPRNPEVEQWDGLRLSIGGELREKTGIPAIFRTPNLPRFLNEAVIRAKKCTCLHAFANIEQPVSKDLELFRKVGERVPGLEIVDRTDVLPKLRSVKSRAEVALLQRAVDITASAYEEMLPQLKPGAMEFEIQEALEHGYKKHGSRRGAGYGSIVGGGLMATVLHYRENSRPLEDGDLVCIDSAATYGAYTADITRTYPVNGRFTDRQREIYDIVLEAELAAIRAVKPGVPMSKVHQAAASVIGKAGYGEYFIHGIGHHLGIEVHDVTPEGPLREGAVVTIEPGIYLPDEGIGVRIEDDILVTKAGHRNLSAHIPKTADDVEAQMAGKPLPSARRGAKKKSKKKSKKKAARRR
ncbi:MAG: aminopeptidase P family protein [Planctomycetota bacterium]